MYRHGQGVIPMRPQLHALLVSGLLLATVTAQAADKGAYLGAGAGQVRTKVDDIFGSGFKFDEDDFGFKVFGGYKFLPWFSVEGAYLDGGSPAITATTATESGRLGIEVQSLVAAAVFTLPLGDKFELFVKPGIAYWSSTASIRYSGPDFSDRYRDEENGSAFFLGAGAGFNFTGNLGARLEYEWFEVAPKWDSDSEEFIQELDASAGFISASLVYTF
jgi:OOP family OmpA-OmpF porin